MTGQPPLFQEYNVHDVVSIRANGAFSSEASWLERFRSTLDGQADIHIAIDDAVSDSPLRYIELNQYGYSESGFVMLTEGKNPKKIRIPLEDVGTQFTIHYEPGTRTIPSLEGLVNLTAIAKGTLPLHAAAFCHNQKTILASGWPQGGKTSILLAFSLHGAQYISDDWTYLTPSQHVLGLPLPMTLRAWQLEQIPRIKQRIGTRKHFRLRALKYLRSAAELIAQMNSPQSLTSASAKIVRRLEKYENISVAPELVFAECSSAISRSVDMIFLPVSHDSPEIYIEEVSSERGLAHLHQIQMYEWAPILAAYQAYQAVVPEKHNHFLETLPNTLRDLIAARLRDIPIYRVYHPHPVNLDALFNMLLPYT
jgi:hypothetical protein